MLLKPEEVAANLSRMLEPLTQNLFEVDPEISWILLREKKEVYLVISGGEVRCMPFLLLGNIEEYTHEHAEDVTTKISGCAINAVKALYKVKRTPETLAILN